MKTICCVLKSGGDFEPRHVEWLRKQCAQHMPGWHFRCWSDMFTADHVTPLFSTWPKWWAKMQIYGTQFDGPALVIDLDTVFVGTLEIRPEHEDKAIFLRDPWRDGFRKPERLGAGFSYLPSWARKLIWEAWSKDMKGIMEAHGGDDQPFYHSLFADKALRWQDHYVDQVVSYKAHVKALGISEDTKAIFFHGLPRPWQADSEPWIPRL